MKSIQSADRRRIWRYNNLCFYWVSAVLPLDSIQVFLFVLAVSRIHGVWSPSWNEAMLGCWSLAAAAGDPRPRRRLGPASEIKLLNKSQIIRKMPSCMNLRCIRKSWRNRANRHPKTLTWLWGPTIPTCWPGQARQMPGSPFIKSKRCVPRIVYGRCCTETTTPSFSLFFLFHISCLQSVYRRFWCHRWNEDINNNGAL